MTRRATCHCEQLSIEVEGDPLRLSVCHCIACQKRTGSAFGVQARFPLERVRIEGKATEYVRTADSGNKITQSFCPTCGTTVFYRLEAVPGTVGIAIGAFGDPSFPSPKVSIYEMHKHPWVTIGGEVEHLD
jgi:hypothetical protein